jgi:hypothetical protein
MLLVAAPWQAPIGDYKGRLPDSAYPQPADSRRRVEIQLVKICILTNSNRIAGAQKPASGERQAASASISPSRRIGYSTLELVITLEARQRTSMLQTTDWFPALGDEAFAPRLGNRECYSAAQESTNTRRLHHGRVSNPREGSSPLLSSLGSGRNG